MQVVLILKRHSSPPEYNCVKATTLLSQSVSLLPVLFVRRLPDSVFPSLYFPNVQYPPPRVLW